MGGEDNAMERLIRDMLKEMGEDPNREGAREDPEPRGQGRGST